MDENDTHRHFSVKCFNDVWGLLEKENRSEEDDRLMRETAHASLYHWLRRGDCEPKNISIGLWLISRVYSSLGRGAAAMKYGEECIEASETLEPFYLGYGYEAAARAAQVLRDRVRLDTFLKRAGDMLEQVSDAEEKGLLSTDLAMLKRRSNSEQGGTGEHATRAESDSEGSDKPHAQSEGRSQ